jgi:predicted DNA repair protein MutK
MLGNALLRFAPWLMKFLAVAGTAAMFLVGGGILAHGIPPLQHAVEPYGKLAELGADMLVGLVAGAVLVAAVALVRRVLGR